MRRNAYVMSSDQRERLMSLVARSRSKLALRSRMILRLIDGGTVDEVAQELAISSQTVRKWRRRYIQAGIVGLRDRPRPGRLCRLPPETVERLIRELMQQPLPEGERWSVRRVAKAIGLSPATIGRAWKDIGTPSRRKDSSLR